MSKMTNKPHPFTRQGQNVDKEKEKGGKTRDPGCEETPHSNGLDPRFLCVEQDEIVISGISGRFPESDNLHEFWNNLLNGVDMVTQDDRRWTPGLHGLPTRSGKIKTLDKFDAQFFGVHPKQAEFMDPQLRMLLEVTHEAIIDAGVNPSEIRGSRTGVFVGASGSESEKIWFKNSATRHGYALTGCNRGMFSNRVSFSFDFHGPSFTVDTACSSSFIALAQAVASIRLGHCDAAIVGGTHICLEPNTSLQFHRLSMLSPEGKCKSFDASANGYVRSEGVAAIFIQKKDAALRSYATILAARTNSDGHKEKGVTFPSGQSQAQLLEETYQEAGIDPKDVVYVEAHGTGTQAGDPQELNAISQVFCKNREKERPLLIGSVKSNAGHAEPASGLMSMAKVLLSMQQGILPANLHYKSPNPSIPALCDGRLKVVAQNTKWDGGIVGMNSFGFGGANVHVILKSGPKLKLKIVADQSSRIPFLIPFSGRTKDSVESALREICKETLSSSSNFLPQQLERLALVQKISCYKIPGHSVRGHAVIAPGVERIDLDIEQNDGSSSSSSPSVWFIFNGMGSQWPKMGSDLLKFPIFENSIKDSAAILKPRGVDLISILTDDDETALENSVIKSFVAITSVQVALVDLLRSLDVTPSGGIIGHSVGELGASYADGCFTAGQTILAALARGTAIMESAGNVQEEGAMAAVGLSWEEAQQRCPPGIYPACHNAKDSVTISGPKNNIEFFIQNLKNEGIFAKMVNSSKMAFHSKYIEPAKSKLKILMEEIIPAPQPRSARWMSSSVPENEWNSPLAQFSSADYHVNNLLSPVLFQEALQKIPEDSLVIEIGPHALLQAILKRSLPKCMNIGLVNKNHPDNSVFLLQALGKLYNKGLNLNLPALYPALEFPVAVDTPSISPLIKWDHSLIWNVPRFSENDSQSASSNFNSRSGEVVMEISLNEETDKFYVDHKIDGRIIFPATGYFLLIWKAFAIFQQQPFEQVPIVLENVSILRATVLPEDGTAVKFFITVFRATGEFQITESNAVIVTGTVRSPHGNEFLPLKLGQDFNPDKNSQLVQRIPLSNLDAYKELRLRGYDYGASFQGIQTSDAESGSAKVKWQGNWVSFLDTVLQVAILHKNTRALYLPTYLDKAIFDPVVFLQSIQQQVEEQREKDGTSSHDDDDDEEENENPMEKLVPVFNYPDLTVVTCEGIQFQRWKAGMAPRRSTTSSLLRHEKFKFTPYFDDSSSNVGRESFENCLFVCLDVVLENVTDNTLKMLEILGGEKTEDKVLSAVSQTHILNQPTKYCDSKAIILGQHENQEGQRSKVTETLQNAGVEVIEPTTENKREIMRELSSSADLIITDQMETFYDKNGGETGIELKDQGYLLYHTETESQVDLQTLQDLHGLVLVTHKTSGESCHFYLFKKSLDNFSCAPESENLIQIQIQTIDINLMSNPSPFPSQNLLPHFNYAWVEELKSALRKAVDLKNEARLGFRIYLISREEESLDIPSGILGLVNALRKEAGGESIRCFFLRNSAGIANDLNPNFLKPSQNLSRILQRDLVMNVFEGEVWGSMRFSCLPEPTELTVTVEHAYLNAMTRGDLSSLRWFESSLKYHEPQSEICSVYYAPLNFRDVMICSGKLALDSLPNNLGTKECVLGLEWSGKTQDGVRVAGMVKTCGLATSIIPDPEFLWNVPKTWTLEEAATVSVAYATAYYALVVRGKIQRGESILIHAGAGGVGTAAIRVALSLNCTIYTTVGSQEKREFLSKTFPELKESSFSNSRDSSFLEHILRETRGRGVDLVLNSLAGDKLQASVKCLAYQGRFLEIGKVDLFKNSSLGMSVFLKNICFHGILLDGIIDASPEKLLVRKLVGEGIESGVVRPLHFTTFSDSQQDVEKAFRFMASGKHVGKILIKIREEDENPENPTQNPENSTFTNTKIIQALPRTHFDPQKCYIIIGGLGGFGLELCGWLIERGARKLALVSRSGVRNGYQDNCLRKWRTEGATILTPQTNITTLEGVTSLLKESTSTLGLPLGGIFNLAMVLADGLLQNQTPDTFQTVSLPKINSTMYLDQVSRTLAPSLDYFVVFSSVSSGRGAAGLSSYAWANSGMERICEKRGKDKLPGLAIMWGAIGDVGVLQEEMRMGNDAVVGGTSPQRISCCLTSLDILLQQSKCQHHPVLSSLVVCDKIAKTKKSGKQANDSDMSLMEKVGNILGMRPDTMSKINPQKKLYELGMDSLMIVEIKQLLQMTNGVDLRDEDMLDMTFEKIQSLGLAKTTNNHVRHLDELPTSNSNSCAQKPDEEENPKPPQDKGQQQPQIATGLAKDDQMLNHHDGHVQEIEQKDTEPGEKSLKSLKPLKSLNLEESYPHPIKYVCISLGLMFLCVSLIFCFTLRLGCKIYLKIYYYCLHSGSRIKWMACSMDEIVALDPESSNIVVTVTCHGVPDPSKIIQTFEDRLVHWKTDIRLDGKGPPTENQQDAIYEPYESLQWRLEQGPFFFYWIKNPDFNIKDHIVFEEFEASMDNNTVDNNKTLEERASRACEFYSSYDWSKEKDQKRPQWQFKIIAPKSRHAQTQEFCAVLSIHHSYGDGLSMLHLLQYAICDQKQMATKSFVASESSKSNNMSHAANEQVEGKSKSILQALLEKFSFFFSCISLGLGRFHHIVLKACEVHFHTEPTRMPSRKRCYQWTKLSLRKLKTVRDWESGKLYPASAVILACASLAYQKLYKKAGVLDHLPKQLVFLMTHVIFPYKRLGMVNNAIANQIAISTGPHGEDAEETFGHLVVKEKGKAGEEQEKVKLVTDEIVKGLAIEKLQALHDITTALGYFPIQIQKLILRHFGLQPSHVFSHAPTVIPRNYTYLGGYKLKHVHATTMISGGAHGVLVSIVDSASDTLSLSLMVDDRATEISPTFLSDFFHYFHESFENLTN